MVSPPSATHFQTIKEEENEEIHTRCDSRGSCRSALGYRRSAHGRIGRHEVRHDDHLCRLATEGDPTIRPPVPRRSVPTDCGRLHSVSTVRAMPRDAPRRCRGVLLVSPLVPKAGQRLARKSEHAPSCRTATRQRQLPRERGGDIHRPTRVRPRHRSLRTALRTPPRPQRRTRAIGATV